MDQIYFTSDPHYAHKNLCRGTTNWEDKTNTRNFETLEDMNEAIITNINDTVPENATLYILGDIAFNNDNTMLFFSRIKCKNIYVVLGNHDKGLRKHLSYYRSLNNIKAVEERIEVYINKTKFVLDHFPMLIWNEHHKGSINLHGHCHGNLDKYNEEDNRKRMDVGLDSHPEFRPFSLDEVLDKMKDRKIIVLDHHDKNTDR